MLESVLKRDPMHPGANHYYIHAVEASPQPGAGARLGEAAGDAGPRRGPPRPHAGAHLDAHGRLHRRRRRPTPSAADVDRAYLRETGAPGIYPVMYYDHNVHFQSCGRVDGGTLRRRRRRPPTSSTTMSCRSSRWIRCSKGISSSRSSSPSGSASGRTCARRRTRARSCRSCASSGYTRRARWRRSRGREGRREEKGRLDGAFRTIPEDRLWGPQNTVRAALAVAGHDLDARIADARGDRKAAIQSWRLAVAAEDALAYDEPAAWQQPEREALGAALSRRRPGGGGRDGLPRDLDEESPQSALPLRPGGEPEGPGQIGRRGLGSTQFEVAWKDADYEAHPVGPVGPSLRTRGLYACNRWANKRDASTRALSPDEIDRPIEQLRTVLATLAHLVGAEWVWTRTLAGRSPRALPPGSANLESSAGSLTEVEAWPEGLSSRPSRRRARRTITYVNFKGANWTFAARTTCSCTSSARLLPPRLGRDSPASAREGPSRPTIFSF